MKSASQQRVSNLLKQACWNDRALVRLGLILFFSSAVFAQMNTADITGSVMDPSDAIVPGATVTALEEATQQKHTAVTNEAGQYSLLQLPLGEYKVTADAQGFREAVQERVVLHAGDHIRQDFPLQLGDASQSLVVKANAGLIHRWNPLMSRM